MTVKSNDSLNLIQAGHISGHAVEPLFHLPDFCKMQGPLLEFEPCQPHKSFIKYVLIANEGRQCMARSFKFERVARTAFRDFLNISA